MTSRDLPDRGGMTDRLSAAAFGESTGVEDWRVLWGGGYASAYFRAGSFVAGAGLVQAIGELAAAVQHYPDVDVRPEGVTVRSVFSKWQPNAPNATASTSTYTCRATKWKRGSRPHWQPGEAS